MTQALLAANAMMLTAQGILLASGEDLGFSVAVRILVNGGLSVALSGMAIYLPKVSALARRTLGLQRSG